MAKQFKDYLESIKIEFPYIDFSNQMDDHNAIWLGPNYKLSTTEGWDGPHRLAVFKKKKNSITSTPRIVTEDEFRRLAKHYGVPKWFVDLYIKKMGYCNYTKKISVKDLIG